ncbi:hypothetical protein D3C87_2011070 [compost metagenome]
MQGAFRDHLKPDLGGAEGGGDLQQGGDQGWNGGPVPIQRLQVEDLKRGRFDRVALA